MIAAGRSSNSQENLRATLDSVLLNTSRPASKEIVDLRKNIALSSIPWMQRLLGRRLPAAELRRVLEQADLPWTPGRVGLSGLAAWLVALYAIHLKTGMPPMSVLLA